MCFTLLKNPGTGSNSLMTERLAVPMDTADFFFFFSYSGSLPGEELPGVRRELSEGEQEMAQHNAPPLVVC